MGLLDQGKLIQFTILKLLVLDLGPDRFLVSPYRRDEVASSARTIFVLAKNFASRRECHRTPFVYEHQEASFSQHLPGR